MISRLLTTLLAAALALGATLAHAEAPARPAAPSKNEHALTDQQREAVLKQVRGCWVPPRILPPANTELTLLVIMDAAGQVLDATLVPEDQDRANTPALRPFARSALAAVTDPRCSPLAMPNGNVGRDWLFRLRFSG